MIESIATNLVCSLQSNNVIPLKMKTQVFISISLISDFRKAFDYILAFDLIFYKCNNSIMVLFCIV